jgi:hypothetical protein
LGYFGAGELDITDWDRDRGALPVCPYFDGFRSLGVGVLLALGGYELALV